MTIATTSDLRTEAVEQRPHVRELLARPFDDADLEAIRSLWKRHSLAEDDRDIAGLLGTLTEDCVYEVMGSGARWEGHDGATRFYTGLLAAFPDVDFNLTNIFIGPQGVCEEAVVIGTHHAEWLGMEPTGKEFAFRVVIFFPWDPEARLFKGERVYTLFPSDMASPDWGAPA